MAHFIVAFLLSHLPDCGFQWLYFQGSPELQYAVILADVSHIFRMATIINKCHVSTAIDLLDAQG